MMHVIIGLLPALAAAIVFFRLQAVYVTATCVITCMVSEMLCNWYRKRPNSLGDLSAVITGLILAFSVPPALPIWAAIIGSAFAIIVGKMVFGGLGANIFNPAMIGRAFLMASFGMLMTTWTAPATIDPNKPKMTAANTMVMTQATPLGWSKQAIMTKNIKDDSKKVNASVANGMIKDLLTGNRGGCIGETCSIALIIGGIYLIIMGVITWHIPAAVLISTLVFSAIPYLFNGNVYASPIFHVLSGGLLIGAFFIATDPVTSPLTLKGQWIFGIGVGGLTILIRTLGAYPEGMMFSILLMNAITPLIEKFTKVVPAGGVPNA
jgi:electron transport complex protein RnfD